MPEADKAGACPASPPSPALSGAADTVAGRYRPRSVAEIVERHVEPGGHTDTLRLRRLAAAAARHGQLYAVIVGDRDDPTSVVAVVSAATRVVKKLFIHTAVDVSYVATDVPDVTEALEGRGRRVEGDGFAVYELEARPEAAVYLVVSVYGPAAAVLEPSELL